MLAALAGIRDALRYRGQSPRQLVIPAGAPTCDAVPIERLQVHWRGSLAFLRWRDVDGRRHRLVFAADTLSPADRRELKLAMQRREAAAGSPSVAG